MKTITIILAMLFLTGCAEFQQSVKTFPDGSTAKVTLMGVTGFVTKGQSRTIIQHCEREGVCTETDQAVTNQSLVEQFAGAAGMIIAAEVIDIGGTSSSNNAFAGANSSASSMATANGGMMGGVD